jgi:hypothetical protein
MVASSLSFSELSRSTAALGACMTPRGARSGEKLGRVLRLSVTRGKAEHVRELVRPMTPKTPIQLSSTPIKRNLPKPTRGFGPEG